MWGVGVGCGVWVWVAGCGCGWRGVGVADDLFAEMQAQDQQSFTAEMAKRQRVSEQPSLDDDPDLAAAMDALVASTSTDDDDAGSTSSGSDVAAPRHMAPLDTAAIDEYTAAVHKTVRIGEEAMTLLEDVIAVAPVFTHSENRRLSFPDLTAPQGVGLPQ